MTPEETTKLQMKLDDMKELLYKKSKLSWNQYKFCERTIEKVSQALDEETTEKVVCTRQEEEYVD